MADEGRDRHIPGRADDPIPILFWEPLEFILAVAILGIAIAMNLWVAGGVMAYALLWIMKRLKRGAKRGAAQHALWTTGAIIDRHMTLFPPAYINELIE